MKTYFESLLFFFLFPLEGGTLELWRGKRANFLKKVKFSSLDSSSSLHSFLSLAYNDEYTRADDNKRKNTPAECEESLQQSKRFLPRVVVRGHRFVRSKRAGFFGRYFFFFLVFSREEGTTRGEGGGGSQRQKFRHKRGEKPIFFLKEELERTRDTAKNVAHFSSARFCLNEKQTEKKNAATKMMARAMRAGRFDFRERIIDFFFEEVRLVFYSSFFGKKREREREREKSTREDKKKSSRRS